MLRGGSPIGEPSLGLVVASVILIAAGYAGAFLPGGAPWWSSWAMVIGNSMLLVAMMALGARRSDTSLRSLRLPLALTCLILIGCFGLALSLPPESAGETLWLGLPRRAALVLYGVGLLPAAILPLAYARTFEALTLRPADLERIRAVSPRAKGPPE